MKKRRLMIGLGALFCLLVCIVIMKVAGSKETDESRRLNAPTVVVEKPGRGTITMSLQFTGDVLPIQQAAIYSKVSGNLEQVFADMGSSVRQGQLLALIDTTELSQQLQQSRATEQNTRATLARSKELFKQNLVAKQDLDNSEAAWKVAAAACDGAQTRLSYARITAPFAGFVTRRYLDPGALVTPNSSTLFTLMNLDRLKIIVNVLEQDIPRVSPGSTATVRVDAFPEKNFAGIVTRLSQAVDLATRTMAVEIDIPNPEHLLRPGMFASVALNVGQLKDVLTLPTQAFLRDDKGQYVYIIRKDTAYRARVQAGFEQDSRIVVVSGLDGSEDVVTTGQQLLRDHGPVSVQKQ
jgi:membrane fusion protein, multidrug efflux system